MSRPGVSIVVPFAGSASEAGATVAALGRVQMRDADELLLVDNTAGGVARLVVDAAPGVRYVAAPGVASSYHARNVGAAAAVNEWLLFLDADCVPEPDVLDRFFAAPIADDCGAVAGGVRPAPTRSLVGRYSASRGLLDQAICRAHPYRPMAVTANLLVRRSAYRQAGGFHEVRSGGDSDFSWRLQELGWRLELREDAAVEHRHREDLRGLARQTARYGASRAWLARRHPASARPPRPVRGLARAVAGVVAWTLTGRFERARFKAVDAIAVVADTVGWLAGNGPRPRVQALSGDGAGRRDERRGRLKRGRLDDDGLHDERGRRERDGLDIVVVTELFPELSQTFVASEARALARAGHRVRILAAARGPRPEPTLAHGLDVHHLEDDGHWETLTGLLWLVARHPLRSARDVLDQRRWRREEVVRPLRQLGPPARRLAADPPDHLHAHFASEPATDAMRLGRLLGLPFSVTAHAYDIFQRPANLDEKLRAAALVTTGCDYNVRHLRSLVGADAADRVQRIVMGVDTAQFTRTAPHPHGRSVVAVGRLVEKKGFGDLIDAAALLRDRGGIERLTIVGEGPLRDELEARARRLALDGLVVFAGALSPEDVRALLERSDVLAMPCVVAADGDRDSMPVVVKEALAMEVPVVATDEVGLPEVVRPEWGRLVPPHDPEALAAALASVLDLDPDERRRMGAAGRAFVREHCDVDTEARRLAQLLSHGCPEPTFVST